MNTITNTLGITLESLLAQSSLSAGQALRHALKLGLAVRSAHKNGQIIGVLDPCHIYFDGDRAVIETASAEFSPYSAPELLAGAKPDVRSDVYALGGIVYHLLTGQPFPGNSAPLGLLAAEEFQELESVILRCLDPKPDRRWEDVRILCIELRLLSHSVARLEAAAKPRPSFDAQLRAESSRLELILDSRIAASEQGLTEVRNTVSETREYLRTAFDFAEEHLRAQAVTIDNLQKKIAHTDDLASACDRVTLSVQSIESRIDTHAESLETLQLIAAQTDSLVERVVESIDSLQSFMLERIGDHPSA
jgi:serine/threonine protein kinase